MADDIQAYGPAVTRVTRTPVNFKNLGPESEGEFTVNPLVAAISNLMNPGGVSQKGSQITLNPNSPSFNLNRDTRHESIHSLLMNAPDAVKRAIVEPSNYSQIAQQLRQSRDMGTGNLPSQETAAYMGAYDPSQSTVPQDWRDEYVGKLKSALFKLNPKLGQMYGALAK